MADCHLKVNGLLTEAGCDRFVEDLVEEYYVENRRFGVSPRFCFRMLWFCYVERINSQRSSAWRCADSLSL